MKDGYTIATLAERPELKAEVDRLHLATWPRFLAEGHTPDGSGELWEPMLDQFGEYQILMLDESGGVMAAGHTIPVVWDGTTAGLPGGCAGATLNGFEAHRQGKSPTTLCALAMAIGRSCRGRGISTLMLEAMKAAGARHGLGGMLAPVRPTLKPKYPLTEMERYAQWKTAEGLPFDPWIRTHWRMGAKPLGVAANSLCIVGSVKEWEGWTGMAFPESGAYIVEGALSPVRIDRELDQGWYVEANYWMLHP